MTTKRSRPLAATCIAAGVLALGALTTAPAQASTTCNSTRICLHQPNGNITNVDVSTVPHCVYNGATSQYPGPIGNDYIRSRSIYAVAMYYDSNGDGRLADSEAFYLSKEVTVTLNPNSRYYYCLA
ncbi:hypothetical protein [Streptomyces sp. NPDC021020]|uniref:hypothetical protein n=1 Tax=Streptomyces sp. NPDC021020 TaxID=3365109 RepID=UPI0037A1FB75